jgi:feruloyl esterase
VALVLWCVSGYASARTCEQLAGLAIPPADMGLPTNGAVVTAAAVVPAAAALPEYCKVLASIKPVDTHAPEINFELDLPSNWNRKMLMLGGGGFDGVIPGTSGNVPAGPADQPVPLARGYAVFGSDSGHQANARGALDASFALNAEAVQNYVGGALKKTHDAAVYLIRERYGAERPERAYFAGGSTGGREALEVALRWPKDWDGSISLYPAWNGIALDLQVGRLARALAQPGGYLNQAKRGLLFEAVLGACDALDGAADGVVSNVTACNAKFNPATLRCPGGADTGDTCLSDAQLATLHAFDTPIVFGRRLASGETQYPGYNVYGADLGRATGKPLQDIVTFLALGTEAPAWPMPARAPSVDLFWDQWAGYFFARDGKYNTLTIDPRNLGALQARVNEVSLLLDVNQTDWSAFASKGGKLLIAHGTADVLVSTRSTEQYFKRLQAAMGAAKVHEFARFYEIAGYGHAASTVFNAAWDSLTALENWVEKGVAPPAQVVADTVGVPGRTRPLCEYPAWAKYRGRGEVNAASSWECVNE